MGLKMAVILLKPGEDSWTYPSRYDSFDRTLPVIDRWYKRYSPTKRYCRYLYDRLDECLVEEMKLNVQRHYDNVIGIGGKEGKGKSHLSYHLAKMYDPNFTLEKGYIYDAYEFIKAINSGEDRGSVFWMDEATNIASNRDWNKEENKLFIQIMEMARARNWVLIMDIPQLKRLDVYLRTFRLRYQIEVEELAWQVNDKHVHRGYWHLTKSRDTNDGPPIKVGWGKFPPMPPDIEKDYNENYKIPAMMRKFKEIEQRFDEKRGNAEGGPNSLKAMGKVNRKLLLAARESGMTYNELQDLTGLSYQTIANAVSKERKERGQ